MRLFLVRHGDAVSERTDPRRPLSARGRDEVRGVAEAMRRRVGRLPEVRHSTRARAAETAALLVEVAGGGPLAEVEGLGPNDPIDPWASALAARDEDLALVGHLPFMGILAQELLGPRARSEQLSFSTATVLLLERQADGAWRVVERLAPG